MATDRNQVSNNPVFRAIDDAALALGFRRIGEAKHYGAVIAGLPVAVWCQGQGEDADWHAAICRDDTFERPASQLGCGPHPNMIGCMEAAIAAAKLQAAR